MSTTICDRCGGEHHWSWVEAFDKFGFGDGDGLVMTDAVVRVLRDAGYTISADPWGFHNVVITSIELNGVERIPEDAKVGYDDPRDYLPASIIALLDATLAEAEVDL